MAKKIVRGITDVKTITNQDFDTNNVNDLLSDGEHNYIHRKKGNTDEYHNLTDNIKTISSSNTDLIEVTNNNTTNNTATLNPKHDAQKEQLLESTRDTITINHGTNGTAEKTTVDTNPQKVLEHSNLTVDYGLSKSSSGNTTKLGLEYTRVQDGYDLDNLLNGRVRAGNFLNAPQKDTWYFVSAFSEDKFTIQQAITLVDNQNTVFVRTKQGYTASWSSWREQVGDKSVIDDLLAQKQNKLTAGTGITIDGQTISATGGAHDSQKEQVIESTRNTISINHGTNGTAEKTTVDTNPQKVLEHENLISDSEYITLNHQQGENTTHIQTTALEQLLEQLLQDISSIGSSTIYPFSGTNFKAYRHRVETYQGALTTLSFDCYNAAETEITGELKKTLKDYLMLNRAVSNGALTITYDGTTMKLINSAPSENVTQHATFTFPDFAF